MWAELTYFFDGEGISLSPNFYNTGNVVRRMGCWCTPSSSPAGPCRSYKLRIAAEDSETFMEAMDYIFRIHQLPGGLDGDAEGIQIAEKVRRREQEAVYRQAQRL